MRQDLMDDFFIKQLAGYDEGRLYARIDREQGFVWQHVDCVILAAALPRSLLLIASVLQRFMDEGGKAAWQARDGVWGIYWVDEDRWQPLQQIGINRFGGFFRISDLFINESNEAAL